MSKHCHAHECNHEEVKFCKECRNIYCTNCKKEWEEPCQRNHDYVWYKPVYTPTYPSWPTWTVTSNGTTSQSPGMAVAKDDTTAGAITFKAECSHLS